MKLSLILSKSAFLILSSSPNAYTIPGIEFEPPLKKQRLNSEGLAAVPMPQLGRVINNFEEGAASQANISKFEDADIAEAMNAITQSRVCAEIGRLWQERERERPHLNLILLRGIM